MSAHFSEIDPSQIAALPAAERAGIQFIDVREPHEWVAELGHIAEAVKIPLATFLQQGPPADTDRERPVILVCRSGARSAKAALSTVAAGYERVYNLTGGMIAWNQAGLPVTR